MKSLKDLAVEMQFHDRTVRRWWKVLKVPPTIGGHGSHRWTEKRFNILLQRWRDYWEIKRTNPSILTRWLADLREPKSF